ncbi:MAG: PGF-pre-PGF domain-containing protein [Nanoarchaeota archaeon]|nr:PGF-pre-PGF domain-containing protein [Nanoarchaeota archaeon]
MKNEKIKLMMYVLIVLMLPYMIYAMPVPKGIDGNIYELDGITHVGKGIDFSVHDVSTGEFIQGKTKNNGRYSVSLNGNDGDTIVISAWNKYNSADRTITLQGVMRNVDLLLNMSLPELPPTITSIPLTESIEDEVYSYTVIAEDENEDVLEYSLLVYPKEMNIDSETGVIEWLPGNDYVGEHSIIVQVNDSIFVVNQSFTLDVINVNDAPIISSHPNTSVTEGGLYKYQLEVTDVDNELIYYYLDESPEGMMIDSYGSVNWSVGRGDVGNNSVVIRVSDGSLSATQAFDISAYSVNVDVPLVDIDQYEVINDTIEEEPKVKQNKTEEKVSIKTLEKLSKTIEKIILKGKIKKDLKLKVKEFSKRPDKIRGLDKKVYMYIEISADEKVDDVENIEIQFKVEKAWLDDNEAEISDLILNRFTNNKWEELDTVYVESKGNYVYYMASVEGFSYFAISLKFIKEPTAVIISGLKEVRVVSGIIYSDNKRKQVGEGLEIKLTNINNGETTKTKTGIRPNSGAYYVIINGKDGDEIIIEIKRGFTHAETKIKLEGDMRDVDLVLNEEGLSSIAGYATAPTEGISNKGTISIIAILIIIYFVYRKYKGERFKKRIVRKDWKDKKGMGIKKKRR